MALLTWLAASLAWLFFCTTAPGQHGNFGAFIGLFPLLGGVYLFARDTALRFQQRSLRVTSAVLIGFSAFLSGAAININSFEWIMDNHWVDWLPFVVVMLVLIVIAIVRAKERSRRVEIEKHIAEFPNVQAKESYVYGLDPEERDWISRYTRNVNGSALLAQFGWWPYCIPHVRSTALCWGRRQGYIPNPAEIFQMNLKAAEQDNAEAQNSLALMYAKGDGVAKNSVEAVKWFAKAPTKDFTRTKQSGVMYNNGEGVPNSDWAVKWFTKAAEQGFAEAQYNLGLMYHEGEGVPENYVQAAKWYNLLFHKGTEGQRINTWNLRKK